MAPKAKKAIFKKQSLLYGVFALLNGRLPTLCLHWANITYDCSGGLGGEAPAGGSTERAQPRAGFYRRDFGFYRRDFGFYRRDFSGKKSPSGTFCQTSYPECHPKLFSPSGKTESPSGRTESTAGNFPPRTVCPAPPLVRRCSSVGFPEPHKASGSAHWWPMVRSGGPCALGSQKTP